MKTPLIVTLLLTLSALCGAQTVTQIAGGEAPPGLVVVRFSWYDNTHKQGWDEPVFSARSKSEDTPSSPRPVVNRPAIPAQDPANVQNRNLPAPLDPKDGPPPTIEQYVYQLKVKNAGSTRIEALDWDYVFVDLVTQKELSHHRFQSFTRISPGGTAMLTGTSSAPPSKVVSAAGLGKDSRKPFLERVVIKCVAYSGGTVWVNPAGGAGDCVLLVKRVKKNKE